MTLEQAYQRACEMHPQIGKILLARKSKNEVAQKSTAASSIHGLQGGEGGTVQHDSMRSTIADAWENAGRD